MRDFSSDQHLLQQAHLTIPERAALIERETGGKLSVNQLKLSYQHLGVKKKLISDDYELTPAQTLSNQSLYLERQLQVHDALKMKGKLYFVDECKFGSGAVAKTAYANKYTNVSIPRKNL